jgi:hypothetical protein
MIVMDENRMRKHVTLVAAIQIGFSLLGLIGTMAIVFGLNVARSVVDEPIAENVLGFLAVSLPLLVGAISTLGLVGGIGLFGFKQWARYIVIVVSAVGLLNIPIGTLKGVYFLWVLLQNDTIKLFENKPIESTPPAEVRNF